MVNSRANASGILKLLDNHLATGTEATYTYTAALDMKTVYREIKIVMTGKATAALGMHLKLSAATNYDFAQLSMDTTTVSGSIGAAATTANLLTAAIIDGAVEFKIEISIHLNDAGDKMMIHSIASAPHEGMEIYGNTDETTGTSISSINLATSTSTWIAGTEITIYGIKR